MTSTVKKDFQFFRDAVHIFSSSLILQEVMRAAFDFMNEHFPLDGLSLYRFEPNSKAMHYLFLVTQDKFYYLDMKIPFPERAVKGLERIERTYKVINVPHSNVHIIPTLHGKAIAPYLPDRDRARLVAILSTPQKMMVEHLSLVGPCPECFTEEHEHKLIYYGLSLGCL